MGIREELAQLAKRLGENCPECGPARPWTVADPWCMADGPRPERPPETRQCRTCGREWTVEVLRIRPPRTALGGEWLGDEW